MSFTYTAIQTLTAPGSSFEFTNIPSNYTDLRLHLSIDGSGYNATDCYLRFNGSTAANYSVRYVWKDGASSSGTGGSATAQSAMFIGYATGTQTAADTYATMLIHISDYASTTKNKYVLTENATEAQTNDQWITMFTGKWTNTSAITSISIFPASSGTFTSNSTATLYGILKA